MDHRGTGEDLSRVPASEHLTTCAELSRAVFADYIDRLRRVIGFQRTG